jgi:hypothetical protein
MAVLWVTPGLRLRSGEIQQRPRPLVDQLDDPRARMGASQPVSISCWCAFRAAPGASRAIPRRRRRAAAAPSPASSNWRSWCRARTYSGWFSPPMLIAIFRVKLWVWRWGNALSTS